MNLAYHYPIIYWNCACISVDASAINGQDFYNLIDDDVISLDDEKKKVQNKMDYAKIAAALDRFKRTCNIKLPDINNSRLSFTPDVETNTILYGLKGITRITEPVIEQIMNNRPFSSVADFRDRVDSRIVTKDKVVNLIKCGAFDDVEQKPRQKILEDFIWTVCEPKKNLTLQNANMLIDFNLFPDQYQKECEVYKLTKQLRKNRDSAKLWYCADRLEIPYGKLDIWKSLLADAKVEGVDLVLDGEPRKAISSDKWDVYYETNMNKLRTYLTNNKSSLLKRMNDRLFSDEYNKYCQGDELQWELDSINFFFDGHPLETAISEFPDEITISPLDNIIEGAQDGLFIIQGKEIPKMRLYTIAGTVIDKDSTKGLVTVQTVDGVVSVKLFKSLFAAYNKSVADVDDYGNKFIEEESFFDKGTHLLITGIQRGTTFVPKVYKNTGRHSLVKIILDNNNHFVKFETKEDIK